MDNNLKIIINSLSKVNYALVHNGIKIIDSIIIINESEEEYKNLKVKISFEPEIAEGYLFGVNYINKHQSIKEDEITLKINFDYLYSLNEKSKNNIIVEIYNEFDELITKDFKEIEVLTIDEWNGNSLGLSHIASFVLPNDQAIKDIIKLAEPKLSEISKDTLKTFSGYQKDDKDVVLKEVASVYYALKSLDVSYALGKPSFEKEGQKIRLPLEILKTKFATCLDSTLLFSACLEAIGLNSLIIFIDSHAYLGVYLVEENYSNLVIEDKAYVENKIKLNEIILIETTFVTNKSEATFEDALKQGLANLNKKTISFSAVDLLSARSVGITPLPIKVDESGKYVVDEVKTNNEFNIKLDDVGIIEKKVKRNRFDVWEKKLLDLTSRNKLVSFSPNYLYTQIFTTDLYSFFNDLLHRDLTIYSEGTEISKSNLDDDNRIFDLGAFENSAIYNNDKLNERVRFLVSEKKLTSTLRTLINNSKQSIEESGSNTLFVSIGTLVFKEKGKKKYAPIILVPVEIIKSKVGRTYDLSIREEEILVNNTLFEYLKINFDIDSQELRKLPYNIEEDSYDIKKYFNTLRSKITGFNGWTVNESAFIGIFSFTRFIMWNDLRNRKKDLIKNDIVRALVDPSFGFENKVDPINPNELDKIVVPKKYAIPLSADSSQTEAIVDASRGLSFVLNGPPGTGKSQTITNMIINSLYNGKSVLFVAQKMAALEVVKKRLDETGLGLFCLELHSNKAQKSDVLNQIKNILETGKLKKPEEYEELADKLLVIRNSLNNEIKKLHKDDVNGFNLYENILNYEKYKNVNKGLNLSKININKLTRHKYEKTLDEIDKYLAYKEDIGSGYISYFYPIKLKEYSISLRTEFKNLIDEYKIFLAQYKTLVDEINDTESNLKLTNNYDDVYKILLNYHENKELIYDSFDNHFDDIKEVIELINSLDKYQDIYLSLLNKVDKEFSSLDFDNLIFNYKKILNYGGLKKVFALKKELKNFKAHFLDSSFINKDNYLEYLNKYKEYFRFLTLLKDKENKLNIYLGEDYKEFKTSFIEVKQKLKVTKKYLNLLKDLNNEDSFKFIKKIDALNFDEFVSYYLKNKEYESKFNKKFVIDFALIKHVDFVNELVTYFDNLSNNLEKLKEYILFRDEKELLATYNVGNLIELNTENVVLDKDLKAFYIKSTNYMLAMDKISKDKDLNLFSGNKVNEIITKYKEMIDKYNEVTIKEVASRLSKSTAQFFNINNQDLANEFVTLNKAISSNGRGISLRNLFDSIPHILHLICPCFLMSPLSVAQYLDPKNKNFDIVIFDEASQITTSDAVGAIARGNSAVIVGDEKQLPPTSFFQANTVDEEDFFIEDGESVLSDCLNISMPKKYLSWHYRSKDESLIAFSNAEYYSNKLLTFPSPQNIKSSITSHYLSKGIYKNRKNEVEAKNVVDEIIRRLNDDELSKKSIGVVTFSIAQQGLIQDKLLEAFRKYPKAERNQYNASEPIFIKNLENVQGDERDVIIFSTCYGPNENGRVSLNFGPLSNSGGEKRLNVAISRAREEMVIYTSLRSEMIDLSRVQHAGAKGLKEFLEYASKGKDFIMIKNGEQKEYPKGVEEFIANDLRKRGYECDIDIGTSEFKIDVAVRSKDCPNKYILGVLCDSKSYLTSKTSKDRNIIQKSVLNNLGWKIIRVWSLDYFDSPNLVIDKIVEAINDEEFDKVDKSNKHKITFEKDDDYLVRSHATEYLMTSFSSVQEDKNDFFERLQVTKNVCDFFIRNEGPISYRLLTKKVLNHYSMSKNTDKTKYVFDKLLRDYKCTYTGTVPFYFRDELSYLNLSMYRTGSFAREFKDIPKEEILIAIKDIMQAKLKLGEEELVTEIVKAFDFPKKGETIKTHCGYGIQYALEKGVLQKDKDGMYLYVSNKK